MFLDLSVPMKIYHLHFKQELRLSMQEAWDFFSSPFFLNEITPSFFHVDITSPVPSKIYAGLMIRYRMKAVFGLPMSWLSEVSQCEEPKRFVYQQAVGPFKFWSHEVALTASERGILVEDVVFYAMPLGWLGTFFHFLLIGGKLQQIFMTRAQRLETRWGCSRD